ncbi:glucose-6-phosphate dehydrogenase, putative [Babesia ovis]|uniref:Glucose-6-phosphate dehydrogenase, putative n=1 Tax=Babesia ovis TaxID=5869 RepID=A0A9W5WUU9_BABOV|nr:glucose-6-phosphate dehydrogenase, putative [Babesia ovis]
MQERHRMPERTAGWQWLDWNALGSRSSRLSLMMSESSEGSSQLSYSTQMLHQANGNRRDCGYKHSSQGSDDVVHARVARSDTSDSIRDSIDKGWRTADNMPRIPTLNLALLDNRASIPLSSLGEQDQAPPPPMKVKHSQNDISPKVEDNGLGGRQLNRMKVRDIPNKMDVVAQLNRIQTQLERKLSTVRLEYQAGLTSSAIKGIQNKQSARKMFSIQTDDDSVSLHSGTTVDGHTSHKVVGPTTEAGPDNLNTIAATGISTTGVVDTITDKLGSVLNSVWSSDVLNNSGLGNVLDNVLGDGEEEPRQTYMPRKFVAPNWHTITNRNGKEPIGTANQRRSRREISIAGLRKASEAVNANLVNKVGELPKRGGNMYDELLVAGIIQREKDKEVVGGTGYCLDVGGDATNTQQGDTVVHLSNAVTQLDKTNDLGESVGKCSIQLSDSTESDYISTNIKTSVANVYSFVENIIGGGDSSHTATPQSNHRTNVSTRNMRYRQIWGNNSPIKNITQSGYATKVVQSGIKENQITGEAKESELKGQLRRRTVAKRHEYTVENGLGSSIVNSSGVVKGTDLVDTTCKVIPLSTSEMGEVDAMCRDNDTSNLIIDDGVVERNIDAAALTHLPTISGNSIKGLKDYSLEYLTALSKVNTKCALLNQREMEINNENIDANIKTNKTMVKPWFRNPLGEKAWTDKTKGTNRNGYVPEVDIDKVPDDTLQQHMEHIATYRLDLEEQERHNVLDPFYEYERAKQNKVPSDSDWAKYGRPVGRH